MKYSDIERDLADVAATGKARALGNLTDVEIALYTLRALHVIARSLERIADRYCGGK